MNKKVFVMILVIFMTLLSGCHNSSISSIDSSIASSSMSLDISSSISETSTSLIDSSVSTSTIPSSDSSSFISEDMGVYYSSISPMTTGILLREQLYTLMMATHTTYVSYTSLRNYFHQTDGDPANPSNLILFYTGTSRYFLSGGNFGTTIGGINREHVWPQSKFNYAESGPYSDIHHVRPCEMSLNSTRNNADYGIVVDGTIAKEGLVDGTKVNTDSTFDSATDVFYPGPLFRGAAARIIFYVATHYGPDSTYNLNMVDTTTETGSSFGILADLLLWNLEYPVNEYETIRNEHAQIIQGNRNPFLDHPEFACRIWGDTNQRTKDVCGLA